MTTILIATLLALAVAVATIWHLAATLAVANQLIAAQRRGIALREQAIEQQQRRIDLLVTHNGALADRNAMLERVQRRNPYNAVVVTPVMQGPQLLGKAREVDLN